MADDILSELDPYSDQEQVPNTRIRIKPDKITVLNLFIWIFDNKEVEMNRCLRLEFWNVCMEIKYHKKQLHEILK